MFNPYKKSLLHTNKIKKISTFISYSPPTPTVEVSSHPTHTSITPIFNLENVKKNSPTLPPLTRHLLPTLLLFLKNKNFTPSPKPHRIPYPKLK